MTEPHVRCDTLLRNFFVAGEVHHRRSDRVLIIVQVLIGLGRKGIILLGLNSVVTSRNQI